MLSKSPSLRAATTFLLLAEALVLGIPIFVIGQDCSSFSGKTFEDLQAQSAGLTRSLILEQKRGEAAYRQIWESANITATEIYNLNLGVFLGRADDYKKLTQTLDEADSAFKAGKRSLGMAKTIDVFKQAKGITLRTMGILNPAPYSDVPSTPKEAWDFVKNVSEVVRDYAVDSKGEVVSLGQLGNAMESSKNSLKAEASLRQRIAALQRCMSYAPHAPSTPAKKRTTTSVTSPAHSGSTDADYNAQRKALTDREMADANAERRCAAAQTACTSSCADPGFMACIQSCNNAADQCMAPLQRDFDEAFQSLKMLDAKHYGYEPPK